MIKTPILEATSFICGNYTSSNCDWWICGSELRELFEVPEAAKKIQIVAHEKPGKDRTRIEIIRDHGWKNNLLVDEEEQFLVFNTRDSFRKLARGRKVWHIDVYYWSENE